MNGGNPIRGSRRSAGAYSDPQKEPVPAVEELAVHAGGRAVISGRMTVGSLVAYLGYLAMFYRPVFMLTRMFQMIVTAISASERIFDILDAKPEVSSMMPPSAHPAAALTWPDT